MESQTNNNLQVGSTVIPNVVYGAAFNKTGAPDTIIPAQTYVYVGTKMGRMLSQKLAMLTKKVLTGM